MLLLAGVRVYVRAGFSMEERHARLAGSAYALNTLPVNGATNGNMGG